MLRNMCVLLFKVELSGVAPRRERCDHHEHTACATTLADRREPRVQRFIIYRNSIQGTFRRRVRVGSECGLGRAIADKLRPSGALGWVANVALGALKSINCVK